jgi:hypothetical protein
MGSAERKAAPAVKMLADHGFDKSVKPTSRSVDIAWQIWLDHAEQAVAHSVAEWNVTEAHHGVDEITRKH